MIYGMIMIFDINQFQDFVRVTLVRYVTECSLMINGIFPYDIWYDYDI